MIEFLCIAMVWQSFRIISSNFDRYWGSLFPAIVACGVMTGVLAGINNIYLVSQMAPWLRLITAFAVGTGVYILVIVLGFKEVFHEALDFVKQTTRASN